MAEENMHARAAFRGDKKSWDWLAARFDGAIRTIIGNSVPEHEVDDLTQKCWSRILQRQTQWRGPYVRSWVYQIARRVRADFFRQRATRPRPVLLQDDLVDPCDQPDDFPVSNEDRIAQLTQQIEDRLDPHELSLIRAWSSTGRADKLERAKDLGVTYDAWRMRVKRALKRLRRGNTRKGEEGVHCD